MKQCLNVVVSTDINGVTSIDSFLQDDAHSTVDVAETLFIGYCKKSEQYDEELRDDYIMDGTFYDDVKGYTVNLVWSDTVFDSGKK